MASNIRAAQKALEKDQFFAQEELRMKRIHQLEEQRLLRLREEEAAKQAKKDEDVFHFVKPRKSKISSVAKPNPNVSQAESVAEFIPLLTSFSDVSELDPVVVSSTSAFVDDNSFSHPILTSDDDLEIVEYPDEFRDSNDEGDRCFVAEDEEIVIENSDVENVALDLYEPLDFNDEEDGYSWIEEEEKFSVSPAVNSIVDSVFESESPVSEVEADYKYALTVHLEELHQVSTVSERELTDYAHFLREAYSRGENAEGKNLNVGALSEAAQREARCQNLSGQNYTFFANKQSSATVSDIQADKVDMISFDR